uniref:Beta-1,4-N-acetylgalactosaminyltransferase n=1 Tax=Anabas testudineus TaxID=64144 RepID=A0A7N6BX16_ANATE
MPMKFHISVLFSTLVVGQKTNELPSVNTPITFSFFFRQYKGQANLHVFEDWCGGSTDDLRKNLHYPLYPHSRTTVQKLAVSPQWTNYGLRIFGYLHPFTDGQFVFALSSDDNSELWLSTDDSPLNLQLLVWVGKTGKEWTVPGEFEKYASQTSRPVRLSAQRRYFFEVIHKQNDKGTDHVEVAWKLLDHSFRFMVIESKHISLYVNDSALLMSDVVHIPQTAASHQHTLTKQHNVAADILKEDRRDTFYRVPFINSKFLQRVLPDCSYQPSYTIKDFPLVRYQGLQFVHMSYVYPNDYTRLTHMESENTCFYPGSSYYIKMFGFSRYMRLDRPDAQIKTVLDEEDVFDNEAYQREKESRPDQIDNDQLRDYGDDYDDYVQKRRRKLFFLQETSNNTLSSSNTTLHTDQLKGRAEKNHDPQHQPGSQKPTKHQMHLQQNQTKEEVPVKKVEQRKPKAKRRPKRRKVKSVEASLRPGQNNLQSIPDLDNSIHKGKGIAKGKMGRKWSDTKVEDDQVYNRAENRRDTRDSAPWGAEGDFEGADDEDLTPAPVFDTEVNWSQTFHVNPLDFQTLRSDWIDLRCNISGNLLLHSSDALPVVKAFMDQLNKKHNGQFTLVRVVNVVKRVDGIQGNRYLLELELKDANGQLLRLSQYIYTLNHYSRQHNKDFRVQQSKPELMLCNPVGFRWNPVATVHFIVPVKNQARWVLQLIADMEKLFRETGDPNFNLIVVDYNSTDMDVRKALQKSSLPRYEYVKLSGNFERSAGLQAGINLINDDHSIVFLCDLHIHFPPSIIDTIRKHCVEGYMAFAPIVLRLGCGATPLEAKGTQIKFIYMSPLEGPVLVGQQRGRQRRDVFLDKYKKMGVVQSKILRNFGLD